MKREIMNDHLQNNKLKDYAEVEGFPTQERHRLRR